MRNEAARRLRKWMVLIVVAMAVQLAFPVRAWAPPRPKRPAVARAARPKLARSKRVASKSKRVRFVRRDRYWHSYHRAKPKTWVWSHLGYRYYVGGSSYVVAPTVDSDVEVSAEVSERMVQMQELVELIHEWRGLNESQEVHQRLPEATTDEALAATIKSIQAENEAFDRVTREAMQRLSEGNSAEAELAAANGHMEKLAELVEALPTAEGT